MSIHPADIVIVAVCAVPVVGVGNPEFYPLSAGILGAVLASMRLNTGGVNDVVSLRRGLWVASKWLTTLLSGAAATVFGSPAICANAGIEGNHTMTLIYFGVGLIGSKVVDLIVSRGDFLAEKLLARAVPGATGERGNGA